jgi:hypothetical protein
MDEREERYLQELKELYDSRGCLERRYQWGVGILIGLTCLMIGYVGGTERYAEQITLNTNFRTESSKKFDALEEQQRTTNLLLSRINGFIDSLEKGQMN